MLEEEHSYIHRYSPCFCQSWCTGLAPSILIGLPFSQWVGPTLHLAQSPGEDKDIQRSQTRPHCPSWFFLVPFASFCFFLLLFGSLLYIQQGSSSFLRFSLSPTPVSHWSLRITTAWREYTEKIHSKFKEQDAIFILFADASFRQCRPRDAKSSRSGRYISAIFLSWC